MARARGPRARRSRSAPASTPAGSGSSCGARGAYRPEPGWAAFLLKLARGALPHGRGASGTRWAARLVVRDRRRRARAAKLALVIAAGTAAYFAALRAHGLPAARLHAPRVGACASCAIPRPARAATRRSPSAASTACTAATPALLARRRGARRARARPRSARCSPSSRCRASSSRPPTAPARLTSLRERLAALAALGIDTAFVQRFDARFAAHRRRGLRARACASDYGARWIMVGEDFRYGARRAGDVREPRAPRAGAWASRSRCCRRWTPAASASRARACARRSPRGDFDAAARAARPALRDHRARGARRQARPRPRVSPPPTCASARAEAGAARGSLR